jgi:hypothetical protein
VDISFWNQPSTVLLWAAGVALAAVRRAGREVLQHPRDPRAAFDSHGCEELCVGGHVAIDGVTWNRIVSDLLVVSHRAA